MTLLCYTLTTLLLACVCASILLPCQFKKCKYGQACKVETSQCINPPCPLIGVCRQVVKPGSCPFQKKIGRSAIGICRHGCRTDADCSGNYKCCGLGCTRRCVSPVLVKPGRCPGVYLPIGKRSARCHHGCKYDSDCKGRQKCCNAGICGKRCMNPQFRKG